ncbi:hypothetical protein [Nocardiopsis alba]|uniref:Secreted protein n=1 Tax=Nocardiopsis alba (strain ATCC BAA-2165 / BE74) TaxID=1205910 RepID=J7LAD1_NOCAA|nr:hypothetical protein [Nocardiopsis alba]AFR07764.1 hypothetical protein B005_2290 [Nocardiopsis alba ATCC BAA-2165]
METQTVIIVVISVLVVLAGGAAFLLARRLLPARRTARLRERFGAEYDHAVRTHGDLAEAERDLSARLDRRRGFSPRPLSDEERRDHGDTWSVIQQGFVDDPAGAARDARGLVETIMTDLGYPGLPSGTDDDAGFERVARALSVDHPEAVAVLRRAHAAGRPAMDDRERTENLREVLIAYRGLADALLGGLPTTGDASRGERIEEAD